MEKFFSVTTSVMHLYNPNFLGGLAKHVHEDSPFLGKNGLNWGPFFTLAFYFSKTNVSASYWSIEPQQ